MAVKIKERQQGKILEIYVTGKLTAQDYERFTPQVEDLIGRHGKVRMLFDMRDFAGWEANALWEDIKFGLAHFRDVERLALVGENKWQEGMSNFCKLFTSAEVRYFDRGDADKALPWLEEELTIPSSRPGKEQPRKAPARTLAGATG
jgi:hypothetical protein